ncbi:HNH endonuclease signature motif containing protein [Lacisediminihabitans changchengi]|uniref:DUF222 domain-containing protein n=1 Tax=Lacisediminihabitans changchengi TaxID=2787634 RepID=A0A934SKX4_9MICO|nr:HNH endonuclease signature motif containing protein [Lacisediminihabitans changchengi]MBK4347230.1 DUF222 domain-containing protein [Lacisediminihabitans changchengi]
MKVSTDALAAHVAALAQAWDDTIVDQPGMLLQLIGDLAAVQRRIDTLRVAVAGELADLSAAHRGGEAMARRAGHARPGSYLAELWQISVAEATRLCEVGLATRQRTALDGSLLPARYPAVGEAIAAGSVGVEAGAVIVRELDLAAPFCSAEARLAGERLLVEHAPGLTVKQVHGVARQVRDRLDEDGAEPRDVIRRGRRALSWVTEPDGMVRLVWVMPPETAGLVRAGIDQLVSEQLRAARDRVPESAAPAALADTGLVDSDDRTMPHRRADAAEDLFRQAVNCTCGAGGGGGPLVTVVVRMSLDQLVTGLGTAQIDGIDAGISATRARILAADANIIPIVLGGAGEVLDLGRSRRLFSPAQRHALAETYGGCAFPACGHPPSYTEAHHLKWWSSGGVTDLDNAIPLCSFHHHRIHDDGWEIQLRERVPYFIPPPWIDPDQTPRRGGKVVIAM